MRAALQYCLAIVVMTTMILHMEVVGRRIDEEIAEAASRAGISFLDERTIGILRANIELDTEYYLIVLNVTKVEARQRATEYCIRQLKLEQENVDPVGLRSYDCQ